MNQILRTPWTITLCGVALLLHFTPAIAGVLQLDFDAVASGELWRLWTGHLTHYDASHLFWDLLMFACLGIACEQRGRRQYIIGLGVLAIGISTCVGLWCEQIQVYRGLSGIDTGLFVWLAGMQISAAYQRKDHESVAFWLLPVIGLIGKLAYESATHQTLFVDSSDFVPLVQSHVAGAIIGLSFALLGTCQWGNHRDYVYGSTTG